MPRRFLTLHDIDYLQHTGFTPEVQHPSPWRNQFHITVSARNEAKSKLFVTVMKVDRSTGNPVKLPGSPSTPRYEIPVKDIEDFDSLDKSLLKAEILEAEGGIALRVWR